MNDARDLTHGGSFPGAGLNPVRGVGVAGDARNLVIQNNAVAAASKVDVTADDAVLMDARGQQYRASNVNVTIDITVGGPNGLDTGAEAASTWYFVWLLWNPATGKVAGLLSLSSTAPVLPAGHTYKALLGVVRNDAGSNFLTLYQRERTVHTTESGSLALTAAGLLAGANLTAFRAVVPPIARELFGSLRCHNNGGVTADSTVSIGPDNGVGTVRLEVDTLLAGDDVWTPVRCGVKDHNIHTAFSDNAALRVSGYVI
jgi:hypothetical protein